MGKLLARKYDMLHKLKLFFVCVLTAALVSCSDNTSNKNSTDFQDTNGHAVTLALLKGKWVIVNYWAAWCESCIKEIPELNRFDKAHGNDVVMVGVNFDQLPVDTLQKAIKTAGIAFPVLTQDPGAVWHLGDVSVLPTTFIINPKGVVARKIIGGSTQSSLSAALTEAKMAE
jgi:thiol-disulfide isomerase/thioredoxin